MKTLKDLKEEMIGEIEGTTDPHRILADYNLFFVPKKKVLPEDIADFYGEEKNEID